jgi:hypothetical protein
MRVTTAASDNTTHREQLYQMSMLLDEPPGESNALHHRIREI